MTLHSKYNVQFSSKYDELMKKGKGFNFALLNKENVKRKRIWKKTMLQISFFKFQ